MVVRFGAQGSCAAVFTILQVNFLKDALGVKWPAPNWAVSSECWPKNFQLYCLCAERKRKEKTTL